MAKNFNFKSVQEWLIDCATSVAAVIVLFVVICFMFLADVVVLFAYPVYATIAPKNASTNKGISWFVSWNWLDDMINGREKTDHPFDWMQYAIFFLDEFVVSFLAWITAWTAPMCIRYHFINDVKRHKPRIQKKYFEMSDEGAQIDLLKYNRLSPEVFAELFEDGYSDVFIKAGKLTDEQFQQLGISQIVKFAQLHSLSTFKMKQLIFKADELKVASEVKRIIRSNGLSMEVLNWFHGNVEPTRLSYQTVKSALKDHEQAVTVTALQTGNISDEGKFVAYLKRNDGLGEYAQRCMSVNQFIIFHREGYKLDQAVVNSSLRSVAKDGINSPSYPYISKFVEYGEIAENNDVAKDIIASSEVLTKMVYA